MMASPISGHRTTRGKRLARAALATAASLWLAGFSTAQEVAPATPPAATAPAAPAAPAADGGTVVQPSAPAPAPVGGTQVSPGGTDVSPDASTPFSPAPLPTTAASDAVVADVDASTLPHDLSPWGMFMAADIVVKAVMVGLAFASLVTWTIWLAKALELWMARRRARSAVRRLEEATSLHDVSAPARGSTWPNRGPVAALVAAASGEVERSGDMAIDGVKERTQVALQRIEARAGRRMARGTGLLATIGSTAPFVGLFGTVWGIMNAFIGISRANTTNLAVVAPGIAEALLATAIGLVAAIPAVIIYNAFSRSIAGYRAILADASAEVLRHLSRDLDRREHAVSRATGGFQAAE